MNRIIQIISALILLAFASLTFYLSSSLIFDLFDMRAKQGNDFVPFVAWANLISSLLYFVSVLGFVLQKTWTTPLLSLAIVLLATTFVAYNFYLNSGGAHLEQTYGALIFRMGVTLVFTAIAFATITRKRRE